MLSKDIQILGEKKISLIQLEFLAMQLEDEPQLQELFLNFMAMTEDNQKISPHLERAMEMLEQEVTVAQLISFFGDDTVAEEMIQGFLTFTNEGMNKIAQRTIQVEIDSQLKYQTKLTLKAGTEYLE